MIKKTLLIFSIMYVGNLFSQSDLLISPFRVVFENGKNIEEVTVANVGKDTAKYTVSFLQYKMLSTGKLEKIETQEDSILFADKYLRIFPKSVILAPNESQIVRIQVKSPPVLNQAELRSHLYFRSIVNETPDMGTAIDSSGLGFKLVPVYGITIPIIIRIGESSVKANATVNNVTTTDSLPMLNIDIERTGNVSTFGQIELVHTSVEGTKTTIGKVNGVAVYVPLHKRELAIPLKIPVGLDLSKGTLNLKYYSNAENKEIVYFDQVIKI